MPPFHSLNWMEMAGCERSSDLMEHWKPAGTVKKKKEYKEHLGSNGGLHNVWKPRKLEDVVHCSSNVETSEADIDGTEVEDECDGSFSSILMFEEEEIVGVPSPGDNTTVVHTNILHTHEKSRPDNLKCLWKAETHSSNRRKTAQLSFPDKRQICYPNMNAFLHDVGKSIKKSEDASPIFFRDSQARDDMISDLKTMLKREPYTLDEISAYVLRKLNVLSPEFLPELYDHDISESKNTGEDLSDVIPHVVPSADESMNSQSFLKSPCPWSCSCCTTSPPEEKCTCLVESSPTKSVAEAESRNVNGAPVMKKEDSEEECTCSPVTMSTATPSERTSQISILSGFDISSESNESIKDNTLLTEKKHGSNQELNNTSETRVARKRHGANKTTEKKSSTLEVDSNTQPDQYTSFFSHLEVKCWLVLMLFLLMVWIYQMCLPKYRYLDYN